MCIDPGKNSAFLNSIICGGLNSAEAKRLEEAATVLKGDLKDAETLEKRAMKLGSDLESLYKKAYVTDCNYLTPCGKAALEKEKRDLLKEMDNLQKEEKRLNDEKIKTDEEKSQQSLTETNTFL